MDVFEIKAVDFLKYTKKGALRRKWYFYLEYIWKNLTYELMITDNIWIRLLENG